MSILLENVFLDFILNPEVTKLIKFYNNLSSFLLKNLNTTYILIVAFVLMSFLFLYIGSNKLKILYYFTFSFAFFGNLLAVLTLFYDKGIDNLGWDKKSICRWVDLSQEFQNLNIYSVQFTSNVESFNYNAPTFSLYYPPAIIDTILLQCNFSNIIFNIFGLIFFIVASFIISRNLLNINFLETLIFLQFGFSVYFWIFKSGQFFLFESTFLILGLIALKKNKKIKSVFLFTLFGIQKIYFLFFAIIIAKKKKLIYWFAIIVILLNAMNHDLIYDYMLFWFSDEGYIFGDRKGFHSFFDEDFSSSSISTLFIIKKILFNFGWIETVSISLQRIYLLLITFSLSVIIYFYFKKYFLNTSDELNFYLKALIITVLFPLLKPYTLIIYLIFIVFISNRMNRKYFLFSFNLILLPSLIAYTASNAVKDESVYIMLEFNQLYILIIHFFISCYIIKYKKDKYIL